MEFGRVVGGSNRVDAAARDVGVFPRFNHRQRQPVLTHVETRIVDVNLRESFVFMFYVFIFLFGEEKQMKGMRRRRKKEEGEEEKKKWKKKDKKEKKKKKKKKKNKAGYTAISCGRVGRGGNARFPTFRLDGYGRTDRPTDGQSLL